MIQRRLAAIMALDMVGYSRLVGFDEAGTIRRQRACRRELIDPAIARHGGRIVGQAGDGLVAEFPSAVGAVECAVAIQRAVAEAEAEAPEERRLSFRIGVNLGDAVEDGADLLGDGVNLAARLEALAPPGGLAVSSPVHAEVRDRLELTFEDAGEREVKNIRRPLRVWTWTSGSEPAPPEKARRAFDRPAIAVLPFDNLSGDPDQEYFAGGLAEDLITAFSCMHSLPVIARNSSFSYKGQSVRIQEAARELGARYLLEVSVRKAGGRVRITVQLIDGEGDVYLGIVIANGKASQPIEGDDPEALWAELKRSAGAHNPGYVGFDGAKARFLRHFPAGFRDARYLDMERNYKLDAAKKLRATLPLEAAIEANGAVEAALSAFRATNLLSPFEQTAPGRAARAASGRVHPSSGRLHDG